MCNHDYDILIIYYLSSVILNIDNPRQQQEIERLQAVNEIQNLTGKYQYYHTANQHGKILESFAKETPDVKLYCEFTGDYEGKTAAERVFGPQGVIGRYDTSDHRGELNVRALTTGVIEVAADG